MPTTSVHKVKRISLDWSNRSFVSPTIFCLQNMYKAKTLLTVTELCNTVTPVLKMVKPGPESKKRSVMIEILNLLSKKSYGVRELHRALPEENRAGSFSTLYSCINELKTKGHLEQDPVTKKLNLTARGASERGKQPVINDIKEAPVAIGYTPWLRICPIRYKYSFSKDGGGIRRGTNPLMQVLKRDPLKTSLSHLGDCLWNILKVAEGEGLISQEHLSGNKEVSNSILDKLWKEMFLEAEVVNVISIDMKKLLEWLKTPPGVAMLKYVLEENIDEKMQKIVDLIKKYDKSVDEQK